MCKCTRSFLKVPRQVADGQLVEPVVMVHGRRRRRLPHRRRLCRRRRHLLMWPRHDRPHGGTTPAKKASCTFPQRRRRRRRRRQEHDAMGGEEHHVPRSLCSCAARTKWSSCRERRVQRDEGGRQRGKNIERLCGLTCTSFERGAICKIVSKCPQMAGRPASLLWQARNNHACSE